MADERDIPGTTSLHGEQAGQELDPQDVGANPNESPREMGIDAAQLFEQAMEQTRMAVCLSDPNRPDTPIVFVNQAFVELTGYPREEIVGRNCRFLQGPETDPKAVAHVRDAIARREVAVVEILNYRQDGTPFWNALHVGPIFDEGGTLTHFYGSQWDISALIEERARVRLREQVAQELRHRTDNLFAVLDAIVHLSARGATDATALAATISDRVHALARAHRASTKPSTSGKTCDLHGLVTAIFEPYRTGASGRLEMSGPGVALPEGAVTPLGLALHELATNALKYGALGTEEGGVRIAWEREDGELVIRWTERGGPPPALAGNGVPETRGTGTGSRIVRGVLTGAKGAFEPEWHREGFRATLRIPL